MRCDPSPLTPIVPKPTRKTRRRWTLLPAILRDPQDPMKIEGSAILDELPGDAGLFVWQFFRDTKLWAEADETERPFLFAHSALQRRSDDMHGAALEPAARTHVEVMLGIMYGGGDREAVSGAAAALAGWASARGAVHTATAFALSGAILRPDDASAALLVARRAADADRGAFARLWLQRSIALARQAGDWSTYADAWVEQGGRFFLQPDHPGSRARAQLSFSKALPPRGDTPFGYPRDVRTSASSASRPKPAISTPRWSMPRQPFSSCRALRPTWKLSDT